jgi:hypothetical protein
MLLHLVTAWKTVERLGDPEVLYCGFDLEAATRATAAAPHGTQRVETASIFDSRKTGFALAPILPIAPAPSSEPSLSLEEKPRTKKRP